MTEPPTFRPRRNQKKLDLRPAIWSLQNHPEEWAMRGEYAIRHIPSNVEIWIGSGREFVRVCDGPVKNTHIGILDRCRFWRAYKKWKRNAGVLTRTVSANNAAFARCFSCTNDGGYAGEITLEDGEVMATRSLPI